ncbi:MAG: L-rhamnose mutarotase [Bacteroidetes bacterium]|nr:L-rhamnose mutarotase [Bacteroidota bacterium]
MIRYVFFLDLVNDDQLISEYERYHVAVWPEVEQQILKSGVAYCSIHRLSNRLVLMVESLDEMDWSAKSVSDALHAPTQEWETLMWKYQQAIPGFEGQGKWQLAKKIYELKKS